MCGRFTLRRDLDSVCRELHVERAGGSVLFEPRYNIAPTQQTPILINEADHGRLISPMVWGIPRSHGGRMVRQINARAESLPLGSSRCAVIGDGFYEWTGAKGSARQPFWFHREDDGLTLMAGLWQWHRDAQGVQQTFAIVTTAANAAMAPIHDRMPAILEGDGLALWLNHKTPAGGLEEVLAPVRDDLLVSQTVSNSVNDVHNDGPELITAITLAQSSLRLR
jgi:putative SOS response-associated peptidase YedK